MFDKPEDVTNEGILLARHQHPEDGSRVLARKLVPSMTEERVIVRLTSRVDRLLKKHGLTRSVGRKKKPPPDDEQEDEDEESGDDQASELEQRLAKDIRDARANMAEMLERGTYTPYPRLLAQIQEMEERLDSIRTARMQTAVADLDEEEVIAELRLFPRHWLERALASD